MKAYSRLSTLLALTVLFLGLPVGSQESVQAPTSIKVQSHLVLVPLQVIDESGAPILGLSLDNFSIKEDGISQSVSNLDTGDIPFNVLLIADLSGSMAEHVPLIKNALMGFVQNVKQGDRIALAAFSEDARIVRDFTSEADEIKKSLPRLQAQGSTRVHDTLYQLPKLAFANLRGQKNAVILFSDGLDNASQYHMDQVADFLRSEGVLVYTLQILDGIETGGSAWGSPEQIRRAKYEMQLYAQKTGGRYYPISNYSNLQSVFEQVARDLRSTYTLSYVPGRSAVDGHWHQIDVLASGKTNEGVPINKATLIAKKGYCGGSNCNKDPNFREFGDLNPETPVTTAEEAAGRWGSLKLSSGFTRFTAQTNREIRLDDQQPELTINGSRITDEPSYLLNRDPSSHNPVRIPSKSELEIKNLKSGIIKVDGDPSRWFAVVRIEWTSKTNQQSFLTTCRYPQGQINQPLFANCIKGLSSYLSIPEIN